MLGATQISETTSVKISLYTAVAVVVVIIGYTWRTASWAGELESKDQAQDRRIVQVEASVKRIESSSITQATASDSLREQVSLLIKELEVRGVVGVKAQPPRRQDSGR